MQNEYVVIVAGGIGTRMNTTIPKQFIEVKAVPIIVQTIKCFLKYNSEIKIIVSVHKDYESLLKKLIVQFDLIKNNIQITIGGETRFQSVRNGLDLISDNAAIVGIHDAARPFVSIKTLKICYEVAHTKGNAVPCISINESLRKINVNENQTVNRDEYKLIQTPQCFLASKIKAAFTQRYTKSFTDDASVLEAWGEKINLVEGNIENIKITTPHDLLIANYLI